MSLDNWTQIVQIDKSKTRLYSYIYNIQDSFSEYFTALFKISLPALTPTQLSVLQLKCETKT